MYISSLYAFTRFLAPEDVPYVFTFDNTGKWVDLSLGWEKYSPISSQEPLLLDIGIVCYKKDKQRYAKEKRKSIVWANIPKSKIGFLP